MPERLLHKSHFLTPSISGIKFKKPSQTISIILKHPKNHLYFILGGKQLLELICPPGRKAIEYTGKALSKAKQAIKDRKH